MRLLRTVFLLCAFCTAAIAQDVSHLTSPKKRPGKTPLKQQVKQDSSLTIKKYIFNVGSHTEFFNAVQADASGGVRQFDFSPTVGAGLFIPMNNNFLFLPELNWVLPKGGNDGKIIKNLFMLRADFGYDPIEWFRVRLGTSIMWLNQHGRGGSTSINNGNSTSTFYYPDENHSSWNNTLDVGGEFLMGDWSVRMQTYTYALFREERRQISYTLFVSYYWDR